MIVPAANARRGAKAAMARLTPAKKAETPTALRMTAGTERQRLPEAGPEVDRGEDHPEQQEQLGREHRGRHGRRQREVLRDRVVVARQRPREVQREHPAAEVAIDELGGLGGHEEDDELAG